MTSENRQCQNCRGKFIIEPDDFSFYEKMQSPPPNYCPECRQQRRLAHRNERTLYKRPCDLCKESIVSLFSDAAPFPVSCHGCWWSDKWDARDFGQTYNTKRSFFEQFAELQKKVPKLALNILTSIDSEYTNNAGDNKNCYLIFAAERNEDCSYGRLIHGCKSVMDVSFVYDSELSYECVDCQQCYGCLFATRCQASIGLLFCFDLRNCTNCIFSTNLRNQSYMIENKKYPKEEYEKIKKKILESSDSLEQARKHFEKIKSQTLVRNVYQTKCVKTTGDYLHNCHTSKMIFDTRNAKDCAYLADAEDPVDCYDCNNVYYKPELCLEMMGILQCYNSKFSSYTFYCSDIDYCDSCYNLTNSLGCISIKKGQNSILNKEYPKEEYQILREKIIESLKQEGNYGNFFSPELSPFGYNETLAKEYFPLTKSEAIKSGFQWQDKATGIFGQETIKSYMMLSRIEDVPDSFINEVLLCEECNRNFRITKFELDFYRRM